MSERTSHLDIESPEFEGKPHLWIQWKGTNVCCDVHCSCGAHMHFDGDFFYFFRCPHCGQHYECGTHVKVYPVDEVPEASRAALHVLDLDYGDEEAGGQER